MIMNIDTNESAVLDGSMRSRRSDEITAAEFAVLLQRESSSPLRQLGNQRDARLGEERRADRCERDRCGGSGYSDSGQERTVGQSSAGGREKGIPPGASREAAVNALASGRESDSPAGNAEGNEDVPLHGLTAPTAGQDASAPGQTAQGMSVESRVISYCPVPTMNWLSLDEHGTVFQTGLAEHLIRAITDNFDELRSTNALDGVSDKLAGLQIPLPGSADGQSIGTLAGQLSETMLDHLGQSDPAADSNVANIVRIVRSHIGVRHSQLTIQLDPPQLGRLRIDVRLTDQTLQLNMTTETTEARDLLSERLGVLRTALENHGITISRFNVQTREDQPAQNQQNPNQGFQYAQQHSAGQQYNGGGQGESPLPEPGPSDTESTATTSADPVVLTGAEDRAVVNLVV